MKRMAKRTIVSLADIDTTHVASVTYFPFPEDVEKIAYSAGIYGWTGSLYRGMTSGLLYAVTDMGNDCANGASLRRAMGAREKYVIQTLSHVEELEHDHSHSVIRFISRDGEHTFSAATSDWGRTWTICG